MKNIKNTLVLCVAMAMPAIAQASAYPNKACANPGAEIKLTDTSCEAILSPPQVSCLLPDDVEGKLAQPNLNDVQRASDLYSWQTFIALNWPAKAGERGIPDVSKPINAQGPRVWETWKEAYEVYRKQRPDGEVPAPAPWHTAQKIPQACVGGKGAGKFLARGAKVADVVDATLQAVAADGTLPAILKDQQGRLIRYEIRLNKPVFDYIVKHKLYDGRRQAKASEINFPDGGKLIKAAWREVGPGDDRYFYSTDACVCVDHDVDQPGECEIKRMGLAGFHIMSRTPSAPQWIWSTFEQMDNIESSHGAVTPLNDANCEPARCAPNLQTAGNIPNQVSRVIPIPDEAPNCALKHRAVDNVAQLNQDVRAAKQLQASPFQYYDLVGSQWPLGRSARKTEFSVLPELLGNTTMETFAQNTSSCMGCHVMSRTLNPQKYVSGDFSFTLNNAHPRPRHTVCQDVGASESCNAKILPQPGKKPVTPWEKKHWSQIQNGRQVAENTYELTAPKYVGNKLHCTSCHLNGGGNADASWWVDMPRKYAYPGTTNLPDRINQCFERSMNGRAVCSTVDGPLDCAQNPVMSDLIVYMQWLTREYYRLNPNGKPTSGFPRFAAKPGDPEQGRAIYTQKCSFCHDNSGQGRYESHSYFRPALWGPDSFNACAGMAKADTMAAFLKANMPYTSGGNLSHAEAEDLAAYIDQQCRPGKGGVGPNGEICSLSQACLNGQPTGK